MNGVAINIPRVHTAIAEWLFALFFILIMPKRLKGWKLYLTYVVSLGVFIGYHMLAAILPVALWIPGMVVAVMLMFIFIKFTTSLRFNVAGFYTMIAFVMAEFAASLEYQIYYFVDTNFFKLNLIWGYVIMTATYLLIFGIVLLIELRNKKEKPMIHVSRNDLIYTVFIVIIIFLISNLSFVGIDTPITSDNPAEIYNIRTLVDILGLFQLYYIREHKQAAEARKELQTIRNIIQKQYTQYQQFEENIESINHRHHDLKHQIAVIRAEDNPEEREKYLQELERVLLFHEVQYNTGNKVLDVILTSKGEKILDGQIQFTYKIEPVNLEKISVMDISSIFGNALDNMIESVVKTEDVEKRIMKMVVSQKANFLVFQFENFYETKLEMQNGRLTTTKKDKEMHGYGLKSIEAVVDKYDGIVKIKTDDNWFVLSILIPIEP